MPDDTQPDRQRLLLLDGHSLAYRAFFALPVENFSTTTGQHTNAVYGFTSMLINVLRDEQPTHIAVAFDKSRQTFRLEEYAEYKAGRNKTPTEFSSQLPLIQEVLDALRITYLLKEGYEADDIIATLATQANAQGLDVLILTGDRDSLQLVNEQTTVLYPMRGVSELARMTPEAVEAKYGVPPARYPELGPRLHFIEWMNQPDFLDLLALADVALDAHRLAGGNVSFQSLWLGTPLVVYPSEFLRGRIGAGLYHLLELDDWIARDWDDYCEKALRLGTEPKTRAELSARILAGRERIFNRPEGVEAIFAQFHAWRS